jgi:hypothetical protein
MQIIDKSRSVAITFRTPNGNTWDETHSMRMVDIFKKDPTVLEIIDKSTDEVIYRRDK